MSLSCSNPSPSSITKKRRQKWDTTWSCDFSGKGDCLSDLLAKGGNSSHLEYTLFSKGLGMNIISLCKNGQKSAMCIIHSTKLPLKKIADFSHNHCMLLHDDHCRCITVAFEILRTVSVIIFTKWWKRGFCWCSYWKVFLKKCCDYHRNKASLFHCLVVKNTNRCKFLFWS